MRGVSASRTDGMGSRSAISMQAADARVGTATWIAAPVRPVRQTVQWISVGQPSSVWPTKPGAVDTAATTRHASTSHQPRQLQRMSQASRWRERRQFARGAGLAPATLTRASERCRPLRAYARASALTKVKDAPMTNPLNRRRGRRGPGASSPEARQSPPTYPEAVLRRFWSKVDRRGRNECWPWKAYRSPSGHGRFQLGGRGSRTMTASYGRSHTVR